MVRKRVAERVERKKQELKKPVQQDPTLEEIWGTETTIGLAEQIRMERPDHPENKGCYRAPMIRECSTKMLPGGRGVLRGQG